MPHEPSTTPPTTLLSPILSAALDVFAEQGYHGASIRDVAHGAGLSVPGVYHHYRSKQEILVSLMSTTMAELRERSEAAIAVAGPDPVAQFDALIEAMLLFHMERRREAFVASSEIRSLDPDNREACVGLRDAQQQLVSDVLDRGMAAGSLAVDHPRETARALATLAVGVSSWYREDGPLDRAELAARHLRMARRLVGLPPT